MIDLDLWVNWAGNELFPPEGKTVNDQPVSNWPFPTKDNPLKPWTPSQVKEYNDKNTQESPF